MDFIDRPEVRVGAQVPRAVAVFAGLALLTLLARAPFLTNAAPDEFFFLVIGRQLLHGALPYVASFDVKPPGLFVLTAASEAIFGANLAAMKALEIIAVAVTAFALWLIGRRWISEPAGYLAAIFYIAASLALGGTTAPVLLEAPLTCFGMAVGLDAALGDRQRSRAVIAAGLLFGAASTINHIAIFAAGAFALYLVMAQRDSHPWRKLATFLLGAAICPLAFAFFYLATGHLGALIDAVVLAAAGRVGGDHVSWGETLLRALPMLRPVLPLATLAALLWAERRRVRSDRSYAALELVAFWAGGAFLGALATRAMYDHYFLPLLPPLALAAGAFVILILGALRNTAARLAAQAAAVLTTLGYAAWVVLPLIGAGVTSLQAATEAAAVLKDAGLAPADRILIANRELGVYLAAGAEPPTAIFHPQHLLCDFPSPAAATALEAALDQSPTFIVRADPGLRMICERDDRHALLETRLERDYCALAMIPSATMSGRADALTVYALRARFASRCQKSAQSD